MGWVVGFEPTATGTTIRRSTKLSYTHRKETFLSYQGAMERANVEADSGCYPSPARFHNSSTRRFTSGAIWITPGQGLVKPSPGHFRVASMPIFDP